MSRQELTLTINGDRFAEQTGWVKRDDGLLVLDRNGNGAIDDGSELFGNNTALANAKKQPRFEALKDLDDNADGKVDALDTAYSKLKVWQDLNQDGLYQGEEMKTLAELGIKSVSTGYAMQTPAMSTAICTSRLGPSRGTTARPHGGRCLVHADMSSTTVKDHVTESPAIAALPEVFGSGNVRNLRRLPAQVPHLPHWSPTPRKRLRMRTCGTNSTT